ncbi:MAG TPA: hypothetical protein VNY73_02240, partial [Bacteroidia bacterium]|nr:hypothetical protein [Bacteroidia bacterium]
GPSAVICQYNSPANAGVCGLKIRFFYTEYPMSGPQVSKYVDLDLGVQYLASQRGGEKVDLSTTGDAVISSIANAIKVDPTVNHRTSDSVQFILNAGGSSLGLYNQVNSSTSLSQSKPTYTNITNGVGILSCRKEYALSKRIHQNSIDRIATDPLTCPLHFYTSAGVKSSNCP